MPALFEIANVVSTDTLGKDDINSMCFINFEISYYSNCGEEP